MIVLALPAVAAAQVATAPPIKIKTPRPKPLKFRGEVLSATSQQMIVRSRENASIVRTFTYTQPVREQMQRIIDRGGYQHGDRVEIEFDPGSTVATKIKGKPSKPI
jgi:hypothetical protein